MYLNQRWIMVQHGKSWFVGTLINGKFWVHLAKAADKRKASVPTGVHGIELPICSDMQITVYGKSDLGFAQIQKNYVPPKFRKDEIGPRPRAHKRAKIKTNVSG